MTASEETHAEVHDVIQHSKFSRVPVADRLRLLDEYYEAVTVIVPHIQIEACRQPKDDKFLSLAVSGKAELIRTGDNDLIALHPFRGIDILKPAEFLARNPR